MQLVCSGAAGTGSNAYDSAYYIRTIGFVHLALQLPGLESVMSVL